MDRLLVLKDDIEHSSLAESQTVTTKSNSTSLNSSTPLDSRPLYYIPPSPPRAVGMWVIPLLYIRRPQLKASTHLYLNKELL